jgi:hypothetical protein
VKSLEDIFLMMVFFEHLCFVVLGVMNTEGQETERFLGSRKTTRLPAGRIPLFHFGKSGKEWLEASSYY